MSTPLPKSSRYVVLFAAIGGLLFHGVELGLMPVASLSVSERLLGDAFTPALGVLAAGALFAAMGGSYPKVGATCRLIYLLGLIVIWWAPDTTDEKLDE